MLLKIGFAWICYWAGDLVSRTAMRFFGRFEWPHMIYNRLMQWSTELQGEDQRGPWSANADNLFRSIAQPDAGEFVDDEAVRGPGSS
jgi:hypothetical protein